ncbi:mid1-interacting protein 1-like isoform X2 [Anthonomus grandis grandis]|uniref:mid1-interacting protein 1-like isoform X2 n=1 Tax=Anthonomus grandis grandis TaxID=2921223 RepID=UPI002165E26A|nr:mid1-interacting protein 1-like isoform X2 [Anthonomus grandis grandis]
MLVFLSSHDDKVCDSVLQKPGVLEDRNCLRRIARNDDTESSSHSIMNIIEKFVKTVNVMDETILVPCRLMDLKVGDDQDPTCDKQNGKNKSKHSIQQTLDSTDLFEIYSMLKNVKDGLLWGGQTQQIQDTQESTLVSQLPIKGHIRRPSTVSVASTASTSGMSDTESEAGSSNENDSGIEEVVQEECRTERIAHDFQRHLAGLTTSLRQMTEAAQYLTWRYQHDIGGPA